MVMFAPKLNTVFASRWKALGWAASVMLSAYCSIPSQEETREQQATASQASIESLVAPVQQPTQTQSPWALDPPAAAKATQPGR